MSAARAYIKSEEVLAVTDEHLRTAHRGAGPGLSLTELDLGNDLQVVLGWRGQSEVAVLVENDQLMADSETVRFGESSLAPEEFAGLDVRGRDQRGAEVAAGARRRCCRRAQRCSA